MVVSQQLLARLCGDEATGLHCRTRSFAISEPIPTTGQPTINTCSARTWLRPLHTHRMGIFLHSLGPRNMEEQGVVGARALDGRSCSIVCGMLTNFVQVLVRVGPQLADCETSLATLWPKLGEVRETWPTSKLRQRKSAEICKSRRQIQPNPANIVPSLAQS